MKIPTVAVITRTKNRPQLLDRAIDSVAAQTFTDFIQVIINDGGDKSEVNRLVKNKSQSVQSKLKVIHNNSSHGMEGASNIGIRSVDSKYIAILDDDDTWHPHFLSEVVKKLEETSAEGAVVRTLRINEKISGESVTKVDEEPFLPMNNVISLQELMVGNRFPTNAFTFTRSAYDELGGYDELLPVLGDWKFNILFATKYEIPVIDKILAYVHHRVDSSGSLGNTVIMGIAKHHEYAELIRNAMLREDLKEGRVGVGVIMNLAHSAASADEDIYARLSHELTDHVQYMHKYNMDTAQNVVARDGEILAAVHESNHKLDRILNFSWRSIMHRLARKN